MWNPISKLDRLARAEAENARAGDLEASGRDDEAIQAYQRAIKAAPAWAVPPYNLGLLHKVRGEWEESLRWNRVATELDPEDEAGWWNYGIAATALGRWREARRAWRGFGLDLADGDDPVDYPCGLHPIRLNPGHAAEVVWCHRIDPARAVIDSIPLPESGYRWRDLLLNDGAPTGYRLLHGKEVAVIDCLQLLKPSTFSTFIAHVELSTAEPLLQQLDELATTRGLEVENWATNTRILCEACSQGRPHEHEHDHGPTDEAVHELGIAATHQKEAEALLRDWSAGTEGVRVLSLELGLEAKG